MSTRAWFPDTPRRIRMPLKIAAIFTLLGAGCQLLSASWLSVWIANEDVVATIIRFKGWTFVAITAVTLFVLLFREVTHREAAQNALRESEQSFRDVIESSVIGISIVQNGNVLYQNATQARLLGPLPRPRRLTDYDSIHPDDLGRVKTFYEKTLSEENATLDAEFRLYPMSGPRAPGNLKWLHCRSSWLDFEGKRSQVVYMVDITRSKELESLVRLQDKMTSLGRVAAGIAHEIRNPLSGLNIYLDNLAKMPPRRADSDKEAHILEQLRSASAKIESVVRRVMDFSKPSEPRVAPAYVNEPVKEALQLASVTLRKSGISVTTHFQPDIPICPLDSHMIEEVVLNLLTNAAEAMKNHRGTRELELSTSFSNGRITIRVGDSGPGIDPEIRGSVFDPFFTTKEGSSGIGLTLCHRIVTDHGGTMIVTNSHLGGAEFRIQLPLRT